MIQFKEQDGQLFEMIETPIPLTIDAEMPCLVRVYSELDRHGDYLKSVFPTTTRVAINYCARITKEGLAVFDHEKGAVLGGGNYHNFEIIGIPVRVGSVKWALYQIRSGKKVVKEGNGELHGSPLYKNRLFYLNGSGYLVTKNAIGLIDPCPEDDFLRLDETGWQLYTEPKPQPCDRCGGWKTTLNPKVSPTTITTCDKCNGTGTMPTEPEIDNQIDADPDNPLTFDVHIKSRNWKDVSKGFAGVSADKVREIENILRSNPDPKPRFEVGQWFRLPNDAKDRCYMLHEHMSDGGAYVHVNDGSGLGALEKCRLDVAIPVPAKDVILDFGNGIRGRILQSYMSDPDDDAVKDAIEVLDGDNPRLTRIAIIDPNLLTDPMLSIVKNLLARQEEEK